MTLKARILDVLKSKGEPMTAEEIARELNYERVPVIKGLLTRLMKEGKVVKEGDKYRLAE